MRIMIGTDGSDPAIEAAQRALPLLAPADSVLVVCVVEAPSIAAEGFESGFAGGVAAPDEVDAAWDAANGEAVVAIERTVAALATPAAVETLIENGDTGPTICFLAGDRSCDVVVVGSRGRGAIKRALLGSVSTHIVNHAPCPVIVVRTGAGA